MPSCHLIEVISDMHSTLIRWGMCAGGGVWTQFYRWCLHRVVYWSRLMAPARVGGTTKTGASLSPLWSWHWNRKMEGNEFCGSLYLEFIQSNFCFPLRMDSGSVRHGWNAAHFCSLLQTGMWWIAYQEAGGSTRFFLCFHCSSRTPSASNSFAFPSAWCAHKGNSSTPQLNNKLVPLVLVCTGGWANRCCTMELYICLMQMTW